MLASVGHGHAGAGADHAVVVPPGDGGVGGALRHAGHLYDATLGHPH